MHFHPHFSIFPNKSSLVFSRFSIVNDLFRKYANRKMTHTGLTTLKSIYEKDYSSRVEFGYETRHGIFLLEKGVVE